MNPDNVNTIFLYGPDETYMYNMLFESATFWAEQGTGVWFISPQPFDKLPQIWKKAPEKEILKHITFLHIPTATDLVKQLHRIHEWRKIPRVILVSSIDQYCFSQPNSHDTALICANLINATGVCARKHNKIDIQKSEITTETTSKQTNTDNNETKATLQKTAHLVTTSTNNMDETNRKTMQMLINLYFFHNLFELKENNYEDIFNKIKELFSSL